MLYIYKASAGSGKTYNLTKRYLTYLLAEKGGDGHYRLRRFSGSHHQHLLAITFTNKATNEMAARIIKELAILAGMAPEDKKSDYLADFMRDFGATALEIQDAARRALIDLLYDYSYVNISTIDSFFQSVLRLFSRELDIPDNYNVDLDLNHAVTLAVGELFNSLSYRMEPASLAGEEKKYIAGWLENYMETNRKDGNGFNIFSRKSTLFGNLVSEMTHLYDKEEFKGAMEALKTYFADRGAIIRFSNALVRARSHIKEETTRLATGLLAACDPATLNRYWASVLENCLQGNLPGSNTSTTDNVADPEGKLTAIFKAAYIKTGAVTPAAEQQHRDVAARLVSMRDFLPTINNFIKAVNSLGITWMTNEYVESFARDNNLLLLSHATTLLKGIINDSETPFVYERLGYYLDHFLIDEFQDTAPQQWENLRPLITESLGRGNDNLIIGDEKQSIYRFRNSDPQLLGYQVEEQITARFGTPDVVVQEGRLPDERNNWRSAPEIVKFNNSLFASLSNLMADNETSPEAARLLRDTYSNVEQRIHARRSTLPGYVSITTLAETDDMKCPDLSLRKLALDIHRQLTEGRYFPKDIAVLVRTHREGALVISYLLECMSDPSHPLTPFPIISADSLKVDTSLTVRYIVSIMRLLLMPVDDGKEKAATEGKATDAETAEGQAAGGEASTKPRRVRNRLSSFRLARLIKLFRHNSAATDANPFGALVEALDTNRDVTTEQIAAEVDILADMQCHSIPGMVQRIINNYVDPSAVKADNAFVSLFQDLVINYSNRYGHDLRSFLAWWDKNGRFTALVSPDDVNALTVSTIHKAKGLEYPCVHIPFGEFPFVTFKDKELFSIDREALAARLSFPDDPNPLTLAADDVPPVLPILPGDWMDREPLLAARVSDLRSQQLIDRLNMLYVAFTRPTRELIVNTWNGVGGRAENRLHPCLIKAIETAVTGGDWTLPLAEYVAGDRFEIGEPTVNHKTVEPKPLVTPPDPPRPAAGIVAEVKLDNLGPVNLDDPRQYGNFMHGVMSNVRRADDLERAFTRAMRRFYIPVDRRTELKERLAALVNDPEGGRWFQPEVRVINERSISFHDAVRRPDRVVIFPDGSAEVIDYKFVSHLPADLSHDPTHARYKVAVTRYCQGVAVAKGLPGVSGYLWYISPDDTLIVKVN